MFVSIGGNTVNTTATDTGQYTSDNNNVVFVMKILQESSW